MAGAQKKSILFAGNPGTGKSTILNGIIGAPRFTSKTSTTGIGVTQQLDMIEIPGRGVFMDTPGLSDEKLREQAAAAITRALKQNSYYQIFFVITTEAGRVRPDDQATIRLIVDASPEITNYSIIVNKVSKGWKEHILQPENLSPWIQKLTSGLPKMTGGIYFMLRADNLEDEANVKYNASQELIDFVENAPGMTINSASVKDVNVSEFDKIKEENAKILKELDGSRTKLTEETNRIVRAMEPQIEAARREVVMVKQAAEEREKQLREERNAEKRSAEEREKQLQKEIDSTKKAAELAAAESAKPMRTEVDAARLLTEESVEQEKEEAAESAKRMRTEMDAERPSAEAAEE